MSGSDDEFDDFLRRRKPVFRRSDDDDLEPPAELDRIVLRQAREAIEPHRPQRVFRGPRWGTPIALAATILVALSVVLHVGITDKAPIAEVTVQNVSREIAPPPDPSDAVSEMRSAPPAAPAAREQVADNGPIVVELAQPHEKTELMRGNQSPAPEAAVASAPPAPPPFVADAEASRYAEPLPAAPSATAASAPAAARAKTQTADVEATANAPAWRKDSTTWLAEIERLRAAGDTARADAEMAEYNRQHRAYAGAPDR